MKKCICYYGILAVILYLSVIYNSSGGILFVLAGLCLSFLLLLIMLVYIPCVKANIMEFERFTELCSSKEVFLSIQNASPFPVARVKISLRFQNAESGECKKVSLHAGVPARDKKIITLTVPALSCGIWQIQMRQLQIYDLIGLFRWKKRKRQQRDMVVLPPLFHSNILLQSPAWEDAGDVHQYHPDKCGNDASYVHDLRNYRSGDRMAHIHWKISLKREELTVKVPGLPIGGSLLFFLEHTSITVPFLEVVYAIVFEILRQERGCTLVWTGNKGKQQICLEISELEELLLAMEQLMRQGIALAAVADALDELNRADCLRLNSRLELLKNEELVQEFSEAMLEQELLEMELRI